MGLFSKLKKLRFKDIGTGKNLKKIGQGVKQMKFGEGLGLLGLGFGGANTIFNSLYSPYSTGHYF